MNRRDAQLRLKRFQAEELNRRMAMLDALSADLERKLAGLEDSVTRERLRANDSDIGRLAFPSFLRSIESRRENIRTSLLDLERERDHCLLELAAAKEEIERLEFAAGREARRAEVDARRERSHPGDMALVRHLRKHALREV